MIWLTWQQHRLQALLGAVALALLTLFLLVTGLHMAADYQQMGVASCLTPTATQSVGCATIVGTFQQNYGGTAILIMLLLMLLPLVVGILVGAPLVAREVEQGTHLLAWTQGITRQRWLTVKLICILAAGTLVSVGVTLLLGWWRIPLDHLQSTLMPLTFDVEGIVPVASMIFALSLAIAAGTLVRRTIPAIAITIVVYLGILIPILYVRYFILPPITVSWDEFTQTAPAIDQEQGGWVVDQGTLDHQGHVVPDITANHTCGGTQNYQQCLHQHNWLHYDSYQPASRFWTIQSIEASLFVVLAIILIAFTIWWIRYRVR